MKKTYSLLYGFAFILLAGFLLNCNKKITNTPALPFVSYSWSGSEKESPCLISFTNNSKNATSYSWNFGDGSSLSTEMNPTHIYSTGGIYIVTLIASGSGGNASRSDTIVIKEKEKHPVANFSFSGNGNPAPCPVTFTDSSENASSYSWDFGDGSPKSTDKNPTHNYITAGNYTVTLTITNSNEIHTKTSTINISAPEPTAETIANFIFSGNQVPAPSKITFTNTSQNASSYSWNFGDNSTSAETNPVHTYITPGKYTVTLEATGAKGIKTQTKNITINEPKPPTTTITPTVKTISFSSDIQPVLTAKCISCHNGKKHPLNLVSGSSYASIISKKQINTEDPLSSKFYTKMKPGASMAKYTNAAFTEITLQWIKEGAKNN